MVRSNVLCLRCINCLLLYFTVFVFGCECVYRVGSGIPLSELYQSFQFRKSSLLRTHGVFTYRFWTNSHCIHSHMAVTVFFKSCGAASLYAKMLTIPPTHTHQRAFPCCNKWMIIHHFCWKLTKPPLLFVVSLPDALWPTFQTEKCDLLSRQQIELASVSQHLQTHLWYLTPRP